MDAYGIETVDRIRLAGAFGAHIDPVHAMVLGLVPDCDPAERHQRRQRRGHRRTHRVAEPRRPRRDRVGRSPGREARDRRGAQVPGALRGGDGHPAHERSVPAPRRGRGSAGAAELVARVGDRSPSPNERRPDATTEPPTSIREEHPMSDEAPAAAGTPRAAAARPARPRGCTPWSSRSRSSRGRCTPFEVLTEEGVSLIEQNADTILEQVGIEVHGAPDALELFKQAGADVVDELVRFPSGMCRQTRAGHRPQGVHAVRAQPRASRADRRQRHRAGARLRFAVRAGRRRRPSLRHDRGLPQLREARVLLAVPAPLRRHRVRAGRPAGEQAALRHGVRAHALLRPPVHGLGDPSATRAGHGATWPASCSARTTSTTTAS